MMNPGPVEEVGQTARTLIQRLGDNPFTLALVVFNMFFIVATFFISKDTRQTNQEILQDVLKQCGPKQGGGQ
jgi:hypothetical protein